MINVWFIRHGESEANAGLPTTNPATTPLTERGHHQAQQVALAFAQAPSLIVTSPYRRTQQTAQPTRERFPDAAHLEWQVQEFTYLAPKRYQNTTVDERRPISDAYWQQGNPLYVDGEGAESFADLMQRVQDVQAKLRQLATAGPKFVVVFSHGRFMRAVLWAILTHSTEVSAKRMRQFYGFIGSFSVPNGSILKLHLHDSEIWFSGIHTSHLSEYSEGRTNPSTP
ncbi:MAG: histidine phosphatase family protein [Leptolyngbya sp. IPPAS B-1204]|nr:histidine phosphatase family protein [Elainella sp. C42_A2020_010]RNJ66903.1 MAG: histidine phosphatase family protein [Leptolyngbya sp. IPPAS B-1204]